jgi:hypothetical protein
MKIVPEKITVLADAAQGELTVLMEGFRFCLSGDEAQALVDALAQGVRLLGNETPDFASALPDRLMTIDTLRQTSKQIVEPSPGPDIEAGANAFRPLVDTLRRRRHERQEAAASARS